MRPKSLGFKLEEGSVSEMLKFGFENRLIVGDETFDGDCRKSLCCIDTRDCGFGLIVDSRDNWTLEFEAPCFVFRIKLFFFTVIVGYVKLIILSFR